MATQGLDELFFPREALASVHHIVKPIFDGNGVVLPQALTLSPPVRIGPLEVRIGTTLGQVANGELPPYFQLTPTLQCNSVAVGFPWAGEVEATFRVLNAEGTVIKLSGDEKKSVVVSSDKANEVLHPSPFQWGGGNGAKLQDFVENNSLFLEARLNLKLKVKPGLGGGTWGIPLALLDQHPTLPVSDMTGASSDVVIRSRDGSKFLANRGLLSARSPVFRTMFKTEMMRESSEVVIKMEDMGGKAVEMMLQYVECGDFREEMEVINAGKKYEIPLLMKLAGVALQLRCTKENMFELISALKKYGNVMEEATTSLAKFIRDNVHGFVNDNE